MSRPSSPYLPGSPVYFSCRYEEKLSGNTHIVSSRRHYFSLESSRSFSPGDSLRFKARFSGILIRNRSGLFDYNRYLQQKGMCGRVQALDSIRITGHAHMSYTCFSRFRNELVRKTDRIFADSLSSALIKALCLGHKENLSPATRELFAETGTMHLLAVSGLHTGAVWLLLTYFLRFAGLSKKSSHLFLLPVLWGYACLTGLSPSVVRAAYILTFITLSHVFSRDYSALNAIAASALFALIINSSALYSVGMQMSYAAYTGIIGITPFLKKMAPFFPRLSGPICVTLAAQIATFPLSAYYFHTFSMNSFIVNLVAIPLTTLLLYSGIFTLFLPECAGCFLSYPIQFLCKGLTCSLNLFNRINLYADQLYPTRIHILLLYCLIFFSCLYIRKRSKSCLTLILLPGIALCCYSVLHQRFIREKKEIVISHVHSRSCILLKQGEEGFLLKNTQHPALSKSLEFYVQRHRLQVTPAFNGLLYSTTYYDGRQLCDQQDTLYIIDTPAPIPAGGIWIVTNNVFPHRFPFQSVSLPRLVILDASNHSRCLRAWKEICQTHRVPLRTTGEEGDIHLLLKSKKRENKMQK